MELHDYTPEELLDDLRTRVGIYDDAGHDWLLGEIAGIAREARRIKLTSENANPAHPYAGKTVELPLDVAFQAVDVLRLVTVYLAPPEDFKPWKFDSPEEYAGTVHAAMRAMMEAMAEDMGVDLSPPASTPVQDEPTVGG